MHVWPERFTTYVEWSALPYIRQEPYVHGYKSAWKGVYVRVMDDDKQQPATRDVIRITFRTSKKYM